MLKKKGNYKKTASKFAYFKNFLYLCPRLRIGWEPPREGGGKERTYIHKRRNWTFCIWRCENFATSNCLSKTKQRGRPKGGIVYSRELASGDFLVARFLMVNYIMTRRGAFSVVHWKTIFLICYLLDYQQVQESSNVSIILLGDKKEPTKWKTNLVQQILLPNNHFPCYFYFKNHFYWRKEKRCVTCLWLPTKANTQI